MVAVEEAREDKSVSQEIIKGEGGYPMDFYSVSVALPIQLFVTTIQKRLNVLSRFITACLQDDSLGPWTPRHGMGRPARRTLIAGAA